MLVICNNCGQLTKKEPNKVRRSKRHFCSAKCQRKFQSKNLSKEKSPYWNRVRVNCSYCGAEKLIKPSRMKIIKNHFCNKECHDKYQSLFRKGTNNPSWKGGKTIAARGYIHVYCPDHPYANNKGYVSEHRLVMEKHLNRLLVPKEVVHHKDGNVKNNDINNLELFSDNGAHARLHLTKRWKLSSWPGKAGLLSGKKEVV